MRISQRLRQLASSATMAVSAKAMNLKSQGREVLSLSVGEPDFDTPVHVRDAAKKALDAGFTRYTQAPGIPELRQAVAGYFHRFYGVSAPMEATIVTNGGKHALYNLFQCLLEPGDQVLIPAPYWVSYPAMVQLADGEPVIVPTSAENGFKLLIRDLELAITPKTRMLILNSPSNPTGSHYTQEELDILASFALDKGIFLVSDEIYDQLVYPPAAPATLSRWWERYPEHTAVVNGLAKSFCMTGWRVGYLLAHPDLVKAMGKLQGHSTSNICSIAQKAALAALTGSWEPVEEIRAVFARRRDLAMDLVSEWPDVACPRPDGAFYIFPDVSACYTNDCPDSTTLCTRILEEAGVALVPGAAFGDDRCVRVSYAVNEETLIRAMEKTARILKK